MLQVNMNSGDTIHPTTNGLMFPLFALTHQTQMRRWDLPELGPTLGSFSDWLCFTFIPTCVWSSQSDCTQKQVPTGATGHLQQCRLCGSLQLQTELNFICLCTLVWYSEFSLWLRIKLWVKNPVEIGKTIWSLSPPVCLSAYLFYYIPIYLCVYLPTIPSTYTCIYTFTYLTMHLSYLLIIFQYNKWM